MNAFEELQQSLIQLREAAERLHTTARQMKEGKIPDPLPVPSKPIKKGIKIRPARFFVVGAGPKERN